MSDDETVSQGQYKIKKSSAWTKRKLSQLGREVNNSGYDEMFGEHMENYSVETTALHRKLQSKMEALRILRKELEKFRTERDQFKLMAETLQLRYAALRRNSFSDMSGFTSDTSSVHGSNGKTSVAKIIHESRERNIKLTTEVEALKQKLSEVQGDIEVLRGCQISASENIKQNPKAKVCIKDEPALNVCPKDLILQWKQERSNFICHLEQLKKNNAQLAFDLKAVLDEKEELTNERDAYKCKAHRLNHELLVALRAKETHPKFLDIDSIILENKYLNERVKNIENEVELTKNSLSKYKTMLETKRKKGIIKLGGQTPINFDENILSHKQVKNLLESGIDLPTKTETIHDLKSLCLTLLDNLNDKNLALNHQKKTNKILATKIAELEQRMKTLAGIETSNDDEGFSASEFLLKDYCPSLVDTNSDSAAEAKEKTSKQRVTSANTTTTFKSTTSCGESQVTEDSGTMSSENEDSIKIPNGGNSDDGMSSLSTESGRSILSSEYDLRNNHSAPLNLNDFTDAALFAYQTPSTTSGSGGGKIQHQVSSRSLILPNSIVRERNDDLKDLPPELAALVQKALHELDLRDFDEVVGGICEDVAIEATEEDAIISNTAEDSKSILEEELNSEDGAIGGACANLVEAN